MLFTAIFSEKRFKSKIICETFAGVAPVAAIFTMFPAGTFRRHRGAVLVLGHVRTFFVGAPGLICAMRIFFFFFFAHFPLANFWTSRGHTCRFFPPPVLAFNFYRA